MMSYVTSPAWGRHIMPHCHTARGVVVPCHVTKPRCNGQWYGTVLSGRLTIVAGPMSGQ
jgi:hypothetical protein